MLLNSGAPTSYIMQQHANALFGLSSTNDCILQLGSEQKKMHQTSSHHLMNSLMLAASGNCSDDDWESMMEVIY